MKTDDRVLPSEKRRTSTTSLDEQLEALTQRFRRLHADVMACFGRLHAAPSGAIKAEVSAELNALLAMEMRLWDETKDYMRDAQL